MLSLLKLALFGVALYNVMVNARITKKLDVQVKGLSVALFAYIFIVIVDITYIFSHGLLLAFLPLVLDIASIYFICRMLCNKSEEFDLAYSNFNVTEIFNFIKKQLS